MPDLDPDIIATMKRFLADKQPRTDVERVVCLGYCLTQFCALREFVSTDITRLNEEVGLPRLSNPSFAVRKARSRGLFSEGPRYKLVLTAEGKMMVESLTR